MTKKVAKKPEARQDRYFEAVGRRKTAVARLRLFNKKGELLVNEKNYEQYFKVLSQRLTAAAPLEALKLKDSLSASAKVSGGGLTAQAEAVRHGLARALVLLNPAYRPRLRSLGYLTRDPRMVERKKYGLKKARRAPQWAKR